MEREETMGDVVPSNIDVFFVRLVLWRSGFDVATSVDFTLMIDSVE